MPSMRQSFGATVSKHPAGEVIATAASSRPRLLAPVGIGCDEDPDALAQQRVDRVVSPVTGVGQGDPHRFRDSRHLQLVPAALIIGCRLAVPSDSLEMSAAITI